MSYTCKEVIAGALSACGDQSMGALRRYCRVQATDYNVSTFLRALVELQRDGAIWREDCDGEITYSNGC